jgi:Lon protease-like protein
MELPLFPLKTVLLPGNRLPLKIFEMRYTDMVAECMRGHKPFGVVLIFEGEETESDIEIFTTGTSATIIDWQTRDDGLLGIIALGQQRFQIEKTHKESGGLLVAEVELLHEEVLPEVPDQYGYMEELLKHISNGQQLPDTGQDFNSIVYQLIYQLPLENTLKQQLLEVPDCLDRAAVLHAELIRLGIIQYVKPDQI